VKDVRAADIWPCRDSDVVAGFSAKASRSLRMDVDCFKAELKVEFIVD